jgi:hypothetical protein
MDLTIDSFYIGLVTKLFDLSQRIHSSPRVATPQSVGEFIITDISFSNAILTELSLKLIETTQTPWIKATYQLDQATIDQYNYDIYHFKHRVIPFYQ